MPQALITSVEVHIEMAVRCAYSSRLLHLEANPPLSSSADAVYLGYHTPASIFLTTASLNFAKHYMSVMVLPIMAETMRVLKSQLSWPAKRSRLQWLINCLDNIVRI